MKNAVNKLGKCDGDDGNVKVDAQLVNSDHGGVNNGFLWNEGYFKAMLQISFLETVWLYQVQ